MISDKLCDWLNTCAVQGIYLDILKTGRVTAIYKWGDKKDVGNYRPITVLSSFNKLFEKLISKRIISFLDRFNIISSRQYGYLRKKSTNHAIIDFIRNVLNAFQIKKYLVAIFIDLSKAFDCVDHAILLKKLDRYGFRGNILRLLESYLSNRKQFVDMDGTTSDTQNVTKGVPQGSVLGPILFLLYINDLNYIMEALQKILFADDTVLFGIFDSMGLASTYLNICLGILYQWLCTNKLKLNISKTKFMIFTYRTQFQIPNLLLNNTSIEYVTSIKYLGVILDHKLNFNEHINLIRTKLARINGLIYSLKSFLPLHCLRSIYFSFSYSYINQNIILWGAAPQSVIAPLQVMQNKIVRNIAPTDMIGLHTKDIYNNLNLLNINQIYKYRCLEFGFKWLYCGDYNMLNAERENLHYQHAHNTRARGQLRAPFPRLERHRQFVAYQFVRMYNLLPENLCNSRNINYFKKYSLQYIKNM